MLSLALVVAVAQPPADVPPDLARYVTAPDPAFKWSLADTAESAAGTVYTLDLVSQRWQGAEWDHKLQVVVPKGVPVKPTMLLWNQGGKPDAVSAALSLELAKRVGSPVAFLFGVPKQPLYGNKREDALIAHTFLKYLETKDPTWPLLFPMAKSVVRAMDAVQAFAKDRLGAAVTGFVVTGASKRGWTSWLTAASGDPRVTAIAPLVIDTLDFARQMPHQFESFGGRYSDQIKDYGAAGLLPLPDTDDARRLWRLVDPWTYRAKLTLPKLLIHGTNDPYWATDATNLYWDDLPGPKALRYVPNAGHDLRPMPDPSNPRVKDLFPADAVDTLAAFARGQSAGEQLPRLTWKHADRGDKALLSVEADRPPVAVVYWTAEASTRDFRASRWDPLAGKNQVRLIARPAAGYKAVLAEVRFDGGGKPFALTTQLRVLAPVAKN